MMILTDIPSECSRYALAFAGSISPVKFCGVVYPYFTIFNPELKIIQLEHDANALPPCILGVTNPFFLKTLDSWPNVLSL